MVKYKIGNILKHYRYFLCKGMICMKSVYKIFLVIIFIILLFGTSNVKAEWSERKNKPKMDWPEEFESAYASSSLNKNKEMTLNTNNMTELREDVYYYLFNYYRDNLTAKQRKIKASDLEVLIKEFNSRRYKCKIFRYCILLSCSRFKRGFSSWKCETWKQCK